MKNKTFQYTINTLVLLLASNILLANNPTQKGEDGLLEWSLNNIVLIIGAAVIIGAIGSIFFLFNKLLEVQKIRLLQEMGVEAMEEVKLLNKESWWSRTYRNMTKAVPIEKEKDVLLDHEYDGIRELDNVLPPWWVATFYISIVVGIIYVGIWHFSDYGYSTAEQYEMEMEEAEDAVKAYLATQADMVDETNVEVIIDESQVALGEAIFMNKCISCHGNFGEGNSIGPNLTDKYWIHGGDIKDLFTTIKYGVPEKGMISWKSQLRPADMQRVASFILSLQGSNPANPKDPQGDLYEPEEIETEVETESEKIGMK